MGITLVSLTCPLCSATLQVNEELTYATCPYCGAAVLIDDGCAHLKIDGAEQAGYDFERGRARARADYAREAQPKMHTVYRRRKKYAWWVWALGWLLVFPIPLSAVLKYNGVDNDKRLTIVGISWIVWLLMSLIGTLTRGGG